MNISFDDFVSALPEEVYDEARYSVGLSEAFRLAVTAGWSVDDLILDAQATLRRPGSRVSWVVVRMRSLAERRPHERSSSKVKLPPHTVTSLPTGHSFESDDGVFCLVCQLPPTNRAHQGYAVKMVTREPLPPMPSPEPAEWSGEW